MSADPPRAMVVWCRDWPVVAMGAGPDEPAAVLFANRVVGATPAARAGGVLVGQRRREAQSRCPDVTVFERDESREARAFEAVAQAVEAFTPRLELSRPGACTFLTRGPSRYFGGDEALAEQVHAAVDDALAGTGWRGHGRVGVADGPFAAALAARHARVDTWVVAPGDTPAFLAPRPIEALDLPDLVDVLGRLGLHTLGAFAALDAADVVARFGTEGWAAHRRAAGLDESPPDAREPPPDLTVTAELDPPAQRIDQAAFVAKALADDLFARLEERALSCTRVLIAAETEHGEAIERLWRYEGTFTAGAITDRVRWQLEGWLHRTSSQPARLVGSVDGVDGMVGAATLDRLADPEGVALDDSVEPTSGLTLLRLVPDEVVPARGRQLGFWGGETEADLRAARALARVQGLLGPEAVLVPEWRGGRGPAEQLALVPAAAVDLSEPRPATRRDWVRAPWPGRLPPPAPAVVHPDPVPVEVVDADGREVAVTGRGLVSAAPATVARPGSPAHAVVAWAGPWTAEERWWDPAHARRRARFQVVLADGTAHVLTVEAGRWWLEATYD